MREEILNLKENLLRTFFIVSFDDDDDNPLYCLWWRPMKKKTEQDMQMCLVA